MALICPATRGGRVNVPRRRILTSRPPSQGLCRQPHRHSADSQLLGQLNLVRRLAVREAVLGDRLSQG